METYLVFILCFSAYLFGIFIGWKGHEKANAVKLKVMNKLINNEYK